MVAPAARASADKNNAEVVNSPEVVDVVEDNCAAEKLKAVLELKADAGADESEADVAKSKDGVTSLGVGHDPLAGTGLLAAKVKTQVQEQVESICDLVNVST